MSSKLQWNGHMTIELILPSRSSIQQELFIYAALHRGYLLTIYAPRDRDYLLTIYAPRDRVYLNLNCSTRGCTPGVLQCLPNQ